MSTTLAKPAQIERKWYVIDAAGKPLGRVAARAAVLLRAARTRSPLPQCGWRRPCDHHQLRQGCSDRQEAGKEILPHPLRLDRRPEGKCSTRP